MLPYMSMLKYCVYACIERLWKINKPGSCEITIRNLDHKRVLELVKGCLWLI